MGLPSLVLGDFDLTDWSGSTYGVSVIADGTSKGSPVPIEVAVKSWLQDGSVVVTQGYDNRTVTLRVRLRGPDLVAVADAEAALFAELGKPNTLTWTPGDGLSPASVFVVVTSSMDHAPSADEDLAEGLAQPWRTWNIRLLCEAFVRSADEVTTVALPTTGTTVTTLDTCTAATGWTGSINGVSVTPAASSGSVSVSQASPANGQYVLTLQKTFAATTTTTKLLVIDWKPSTGAGLSLRATGDGLSLPLVAEGASATTGFVRSWFRVGSASSLAVVRLDWAASYAAPAGARPALTLSVDNVSVTDVPPVVGTGRQQLLALSLNGSAPTQGSLAVQSETTSLGETLVYTYPADETTDGYTPPLRQFRTAGSTVTADSTTVSGSREPIGGSGCTIQVPLNLLPRGAYVLIVRLGAPAGFSVNTTFTWTISTTLGSNAIGPTSRTSPVLTVPAAAFANYTLGRLSLPTVDLDPFTPAKLNIQFSATNVNVMLDEAWLYNTDIGQLTWVDCGSGTAAVGGASKRLFLESPSIARPRPSVQIGHSADRSDAFYPVGAVKSWQGPRMAPPTLKVHTVTTNATDAVVSARYTPAWHTNAAS